MKVQPNLHEVLEAYKNAKTDYELSHLKALLFQLGWRV